MDKYTIEQMIETRIDKLKRENGELRTIIAIMIMPLQERIQKIEGVLTILKWIGVTVGTLAIGTIYNIFTELLKH